MNATARPRGVKVVAEERFSVTYDGPALEGGRMNVRELAPAMLALADAVQSAQRLMQPDGPTSSLEVHATREGSFAIDFLLTELPGLLDRAADLFSGRDVTAALAAKDVVNTVVAAVAGIVLLRRRRIRSQEPVETSGLIRITFVDGTVLEVPPATLPLMQDRAFREQIKDFVAPLEQEGVDEVRVETADHPPTRVTKQDLRAFDLPEIAEQLVATGVARAQLQPLNVAFQAGNKWRVTDGTNVFYVGIEDSAFLLRTESGEPFRRGDILDVELRTSQYRSGGALRTERSIVRVVEHIAGAQQIELPLALGQNDLYPDEDTDEQDDQNEQDDQDDVLEDLSDIAEERSRLGEDW